MVFNPRYHPASTSIILNYPRGKSVVIHKPRTKAYLCIYAESIAESLAFLGGRAYSVEGLQSKHAGTTVTCNVGEMHKCERMKPGHEGRRATAQTFVRPSVPGRSPRSQAALFHPEEQPLRL